MGAKESGTAAKPLSRYEPVLNGSLTPREDKECPAALKGPAGQKKERSMEAV